MNIIRTFGKIIKNNIFMLSYIYRLCPSHIFVTLFVSLLGSLSAVINLFITRYIINTIQAGNNDYLFNTVLTMIIFLLAINLLYTLTNNYIQQKIIPKNTQKICRQMQTELFNKASLIEMKHYDEPDFFNIFTMALQQSDARAQGVLNTINSFISSLFSIGALVSLIVALEPILFLLVIINVAVSFFINTIITKLHHSFSEERIQPQREMEYSKIIFYRLENAKELRIYNNLKNVLIHKLNIASDNIIRLINSYGKKLVFHSCVQSMINNIITSLTLIYLAFKVIKNMLLIGDFVTLTSSTQQLSMQISELLNAFPQLYEHSLYINNFKEFIEYQPPQNYGKGLQIESVNSIKFKNVSFTYPLCTRETLKDISFEISAGEKIAIVGENGAGKSTLVKLITGLYETSKGEIIINNKNLNEYESNAFNECVGVVFQDYKVYALSIAENILMRKVDVSKEDEKLVTEALKFVGLHEKVMQLPAGIHTKLTREFSNEGAVFSGGENQKIALARAYVRNCSFLILDEPSSFLDPIAEYEMLNKMMCLSRNKCSIFISHRLKNIRNVDHIYVISKGSITEHGTHDALMEKGGMYFNMYSKQAHEIGGSSSNNGL